MSWEENESEEWEAANNTNNQTLSQPSTSTVNIISHGLALDSSYLPLNLIFWLWISVEISGNKLSKKGAEGGNYVGSGGGWCCFDINKKPARTSSSPLPLTAFIPPLVLINHLLLCQEDGPCLLLYSQLWITIERSSGSVQTDVESHYIRRWKSFWSMKESSLQCPLLSRVMPSIFLTSG